MFQPHVVMSIKVTKDKDVCRWMDEEKDDLNAISLYIDLTLIRKIFCTLKNFLKKKKFQCQTKIGVEHQS